MPQYIDVIIRTGLVTIGSFLLLSGHEKELNRNNWLGVALLFTGFLFSAYQELIIAKYWTGVIWVSIIVLGSLSCMLIRRAKSPKPPKH